nr:MAG: hypothetical protein [Microvirus sp.]
MARRSRYQIRSETTFSSRPAAAKFRGFDDPYSPFTFSPQAPPGTFFRSARPGLSLFVPPPVRSQPRSAARPYTFLSPSLAFKYPKRALVCVRRKQRREVLFARRRTGMGARSVRRRTHDSSYRC